VMWSAFDKSGREPLDSLPKTASDVAAVLGLHPKVTGKRLLLLYYSLPLQLDAYIPRVVEAYASDPWVYFFKPASAVDADAGHGRTYVWPSHASRYAGLPEVVHRPIKGSSLLNQLEELS
jgi:hypothetical protein